MKFNVVVGNPPYQCAHGSNRSIYPRFYEVALSLAPVVAFIAPITWLTSRKPQLAQLKQLLLSTGLHEVVQLNAQKTFGVVVDALGYTITKPGGAYAPVVTAADTILHKLKSIVGVKFNAQRGRHTNVGKDGTCWDNSVSFTQSSQHPYRMLNKVDVGGAPQYAYSNKTATKSMVGTTKVVWGALTSKNHLGTTLVTDEQVELSHMCVFVPVGTFEEGYALRSFLQSKLFRFVLPLLRPNTTNTVGAFRDITLPPLNCLLSDQELYQHFNLTQEEIDHVEAAV